MKLQTEKLTIEASGDLDVGAGAAVALGTGATVEAGPSAEVDFMMATKFFIPQIANASLPTASGVEGMIVYDTTNNKLVVSNGTAWETITSST